MGSVEIEGKERFRGLVGDRGGSRTYLLVKESLVGHVPDDVEKVDRSDPEDWKGGMEL